jgi:two-component system sensor histidine kinase/response regulator
MSGNSVIGGPGLDPHSFTSGGSISPPVATAPEIDLPSLMRRCLDDAAFCAMILHKFAARAGDQLAALERALESNNFIDLAREAHTLQGVAANLSAARLRSHAEALEAAAKQNDACAAQAALANVRAEMTRCTLQVPELIAKIATRV